MRKIDRLKYQVDRIGATLEKYRAAVNGSETPLFPAVQGFFSLFIFSGPVQFQLSTRYQLHPAGIHFIH
jgi:hypothetical protein